MVVRCIKGHEMEYTFWNTEDGEDEGYYCKICDVFYPSDVKWIRIQRKLVELGEVCDSCEAGDPCWCCGISQQIKKLQEEVKCLRKSHS